MVKRIILLASFCMLIAWPSLAQQDPQFTQYMFNTLYYNPAFAGVDGVTKVTAIARMQWLGYSPTTSGGGAPNTQMISMSTPVYKLNGGFGAYIVNDHLGPQNNLEAQTSYAYHLGIKDAKLSFGVRVGMFSQTINSNLYRFQQHPDGSIPDSPSSQVRPDVAMGVFFRKEKYYAGLSINHLTKPTFDFGTSQRSPLQPHLYFTGGYYYEVNFDVKLHFSTLVQSDLTKTTVNLSGLAYFKDTMWGGLAFRQSEAATLLLGYSLLKDKSLKLGYALDYIIKDQAAKQPTSHEFMLSYELPTNPGAGKKVVRTPRYRH
jgi:type IX secretion system PorP/SprF family membrane protein